MKGHRKGPKLGVVGLQGDVGEHIAALEAALDEFGLEGSAVWVRRPSDLTGIRALCIPGGESTTISKLLSKFDLKDRIKALAMDGLPVLGTCAGCVLLAKEGDAQVERTRTELLGLMDMSVDRNAFGPQRESFESPVQIDGLGEYPGVFIRAPLITKVWGGCEAIGRLEGMMVLARQGSMLAASFHPELTGDARFYRILFEML